MTLHISCEQARRLLAHYHFTPTDLPGVFTRLGTVQYDPLNPVGRNPDLVLQARVPGYQVDDWQQAAYTDRLIYDAWDKMACLVPVSDWPMRALIRTRHRPYHDRDILQNDPEGVALVLSALDERGPLSSLEFEDRSPVANGGLVRLDAHQTPAALALGLRTAGDPSPPGRTPLLRPARAGHPRAAF